MRDLFLSQYDQQKFKYITAETIDFVRRCMHCSIHQQIYCCSPSPPAAGRRSGRQHAAGQAATQEEAPEGVGQSRAVADEVGGQEVQSRYHARTRPPQSAARQAPQLARRALAALHAGPSRSDSLANLQRCQLHTGSERDSGEGRRGEAQDAPGVRQVWAQGEGTGAGARAAWPPPLQSPDRTSAAAPASCRSASSPTAPTTFSAASQLLGEHHEMQPPC